MDRRPEIRKESLLALLELIRDYSEHFNDELWKSIFSSALLPLLDPIRSTMEGNDEGWLVEALLDRAPPLSALLAEMYPFSSTFLPQLYSVILEASKSDILPNIAQLSVKVFVEVFKSIKLVLDPSDTMKAIEAFRRLISETFPTTLVERLTEETNNPKVDILNVVVSTIDGQRCIQSSLVAMSESVMKGGDHELAWKLFDLMVLQAKLSSEINCLNKTDRMKRLQCDGVILSTLVSNNAIAEILSSLSEIETSGWQACVGVLELARNSYCETPNVEGEFSKHCLKHISLVDSILDGDNDKLSEMALSIISSLDQLEEKEFSFAMQKLFLKLSKLILSEQVSARQLYHNMLVSKIWAQIKHSL